MGTQTMGRRLRAVAVLALLWAITWSVVGAAIGVYQYVAGWPIAVLKLPGFASPFIAVVLSYAFGGAKGGAISGALFALVLSIAEGKQSAANLSFGRSAVWGLLGAVLVPVTMLGVTLVRFPFLLSDIPLSLFLVYWFFLAVLGAGCALLTVWLARRGINRDVPGAAA